MEIIPATFHSLQRDFKPDNLFTRCPNTCLEKIPGSMEEKREAVCVYLRQHGTADEQQEIEALVVSKEGVPDADDIWQQELLGQEQRQPAEGKELGFDVLFLLSDRHQANNEYVLLVSSLQARDHPMFPSPSPPQRCSKLPAHPAAAGKPLHPLETLPFNLD